MEERMSARPQENQTRLLLIDNRLLIREGLRLLLEREGWKIVAEASDCAEALSLAARERPHIILLNMLIGDNRGLEFLEQLSETANRAVEKKSKNKDNARRTGDGSRDGLTGEPAAKVVLLAEPSCVPQCRRAIVLGAKGVVLTERPSSALFTAIHRVSDGEVSIDSKVMAEILAIASPDERTRENPEKARIESLTPREIEVIQLLAEGLKNHQIAKRLFVSEGTVRHYLNRVFTKLNITDRSKLLIYAFRHGIAKPF
jgi:DNA-binding NarL/FixJ family response regulator